jgi:hypothetical protein
LSEYYYPGAHECLSALSSIISDTVYHRVETVYESPEGAPRESPTYTLRVIVKSVDAPSLDEIPILVSIEEASYTLGVYYTKEGYEEGGGSREERLASIIRSILRGSEPAVIVMPQPLAVGVMSYLGPREADALERAPKIHVEIEFVNHLYLPASRVTREVELVGKRNSAASYARIERLELMARELGLTRVKRKLLNNNAEIMEYVTELGPRGLSLRVPVTKLALYVRALSQCFPEEIGSINPVRLRERGSHTIYLIRVPPELAERFLFNLASWRGRRPDAEQASYYIRGHMEALTRLASLLSLV